MRTETGQFLTKLCLEHLGNREHAVCRPLVYRAMDGTVFTVPAGFVTDGASVPRPMWWLYPPFGDEYEPAAVLHDYIYQCAELIEGKTNWHITRAEADALFLEAMQASGFRFTGRWAIYMAVRVGGWMTWNAYRKEDIDSSCL